MRKIATKIARVNVPLVCHEDFPCTCKDYNYSSSTLLPVGKSYWLGSSSIGKSNGPVFQRRQLKFSLDTQHGLRYVLATCNSYGNFILCSILWVWYRNIKPIQICIYIYSPTFRPQAMQRISASNDVASLCVVSINSISFSVINGVVNLAKLRLALHLNSLPGAVIYILICNTPTRAWRRGCRDNSSGMLTSHK